MASWLQKRLRDAEALLEQADKTAQRAVVRDTRMPDPSSRDVSETPGAAFANTAAERLPARSAQSADKGDKQPQATQAYGRVAVPLLSAVPDPPAAGRPVSTPGPTSAASKPPVYRAVQSNAKTGHNKQASSIPGGSTAVPSQRLQIPFMPAAPDPGRNVSAQQAPAAIRFMPAAPKPEGQVQTPASIADTAVSSSPSSASEEEPAQSTSSHGVVNNGKHPMTSETSGDAVDPQALAADPDPVPVQLPNLTPNLTPAAESQEKLLHGEQTVDETTDASLPDASLAQASPAAPQAAALLQPEASDSPVRPSASLHQETVVSAVEASAQQSPLSGQASKLRTTPFSSAKPLLSEEPAGAAQQPQDVAANSPLTQREGSSAQAAAVADAIKQAAQLSAQTSSSGPGSEGAGGAGREVLLARLVEQLKARLQAYKEENQQLEELLHQSDARASSSLREVDRLEDALAQAQAQRLSAEAALSDSSTEQQGQVQAAQQALQAANRDLTDCQARIGDLEATNATLIQEAQVSEGRILVALQDEVTAAEARLEEERAAHSSTQRTAAAREQAVQSSMAEGATALASMQRLVEERTQQASSSQQALMHLQQENALLTSRLRTAQEQAALRQDAEGDQARLETQAQLLQLEHGREQAAQSLAIAESARASAEAQVQQLQQAVNDLQRHKPDRGHEDLHARFKEVTELLYTKQTQLERMAAEKAAQQLAHEREIAHAKDDAERVKRRIRTERSGTAFTSNADDVIVPMDSLGEAFDRLANNNRVGSYVKAGARALDATASAAVRLIKQYPLGRLFVFLYIISIHLFIYILISKMQRSALDHLGQPSIITMEDLNSRMKRAHKHYA